MSNVELSDGLFAKLAGWEAVKAARGLVAADHVLSSDWQPPLLRGVVQEGSASYRAGLVIKSASDAENLCSCRASRQRGLICAHSVAVGLHYLKGQKPAVAPAEKKPAESGKAVARRDVKKLRRAGAGEDGEALEVFVILPPNFAEAVVKGRVMLYGEGKWRNGRVPLNALPPATPFVVDDRDGALLDALELLNEGDTPAMLMLNAVQFAELLPKLTGHPRVTLGRAQAVEILGESLRVAVRASLESNGEIVLELAEAVPAGLIRGATTWVFDGQRLRPLGLPAGLESLLDGVLRIARSRVPQFLNLDWPRLAADGGVQANFSPGDFALETAVPRFKLHLAGGLAMLQARLECFYGERRVGPGATAEDALWLADPESPTRYLTRNFEAERNALGRLVRSGFTGPDAQGLLHLKGQDPVLNFFAREYPRLEKEWDVTLEERLERSTLQNLERIEPRFQIRPSGEQWFDLDVAYDTRGGERFAAADIQRLLLSGQSHTRMQNGKFALLDTGAVEELQEVMLDCAPQQHGGGYRLNNAQAGFLDATLRQQPGWQVQAPAAWAQRAAQQRGEVKLEPPPLGELEPVLRPYQKEGVAWLGFLRENGFGGILADEMGLGKTLQVLAHLWVNKVGQASCLSAKASEAPTDGGASSGGGRVSAVGDRQDACPTLPFTPFDRTAPFGFYGRHLPHWRQAGCTYFVTFRLADSLPREKLNQFEAELAVWLRTHPEPHSDEDRQEYHERFTERFHAWLDAGSGECWLRRPEVAGVVEQALRFFDGQRYVLGHYVVMPNHVHALVRPEGHRLADILHSWKSFTAKQINKIVGQTGALWQDESFDHVVRNEAQLERFGSYIQLNPIKGGLKPDEFRLGYSSGLAGNVGQASCLSTKAGEAPTGGEVSSEGGRVLAVGDRQDACPTLGGASPSGEVPSGGGCVLAVVDRQDACPTLGGAALSGGASSGGGRVLAVGDRQDACPTLVVCPTSLVFNWAAESAKFTPGLRVLVLQGHRRHELFGQIGNHDLVITSYALLRRDAEQYRGVEFDTVVLDEAQHIKNRQTQNAQAVKAIRARHRLVLTGTPLENSVLDLWSIFDFLMPDYLGAAADFRERYETPIVRGKDAGVQARLARRLRPFMLRRLKREVAGDLPEKIEQVSYCELTEDQRAVYQQVLEASRREIVNAMDANGLAKSRMVVLTALLRLRQICCDLRLLKLRISNDEFRMEGTETPDDGGAADKKERVLAVVDRQDACPTLPASGKVELFGELLEEVIDGGHRVLVFSQFTSMLALLREQLAAENIEYCYLDGSTKDRAGVVGKFQGDAGIPVFLISLKAGGVGLNLTGADTVIHFDPWWNPAVEAQATDRAHRIGQRRVVTSYKLITRGTVEEKILNLQTRKRALMQNLLGGEEQLVEALSWEEIRDLLTG